MLLLKQLINDCPTMYFLYRGRALFIHRRSDYGIGGYLYQIVDKERPVAFISKSLTSTQLKWLLFKKKRMLF
jgi:hypothetical protein